MTVGRMRALLAVTCFAFALGAIGRVAGADPSATASVRSVRTAEPIAVAIGTTVTGAVTATTTAVAPPEAVPEASAGDDIVGAAVDRSSGVGAASDTILRTCAVDADGWSASGTVTNPTPGAVDYVIVASVLDADGGTVAVASTRVVGVGSSSTAPWSVHHGATGSGLRCVLRVTRTAV